MINKIKLIAVAKDEAAYLPDWIFHHLYFGFDAIDIYVNNTLDNTDSIATALKNESRVNFLNGDNYFSGEFAKPQEAVYESAVDLARSEGFSHVLFLDIDEFWTPKNFKDSIKVCLNKVNGDVISFEWLIRHSEKVPFSNAFENQLEGAKGRFVKSIFSLSLNLQRIGVHNVISKNASYKLADNLDFYFENGKNGKVSSLEQDKELKDYFVVHRMYRSEMEYISLLGRGRPKQSNALTSMFKDNRSGYCIANNLIIFLPDANLLAIYQNKLEMFLKDHQLLPLLNMARNYVEGRYFRVLNLITSAPIHEVDILQRLLKNISLTEVRKAFKHLTSCAITPNDVNTLRDLAIKLEKNNLTDAYKLMLIAQGARPSGSVINKKIKEYKKELKL